MIILREKEYSTRLARTIAGFNKNILRLPKIKAYKKAINEQDGILKKAVKGINLIDNIYYTPGNIIDKGISKTIENPVTTLGIIAGKITDVTNPETIAIPKSTISAVIGNKILPEKTKSLLKGISNKYKKSKLSKTIKKSPSIPEMAYFIGELGRGSGF